MSNNSAPVTAKERLRKLANPKKAVFWGILLIIAVVVFLIFKGISLIPWGAGKLGEYTGGEYEVAEETYTFYLDKDDAYWPSFEVSEDMELSVLGENGQWESLGTMSKCRLTAKNFSNLFGDFSKGWLLGNPTAMLKDNVRAWSLVDEGNTLYYLIQQKTGEIYIAIGNYDDRDAEPPYTNQSRILWLYKLEEK